MTMDEIFAAEDVLVGLRAPTKRALLDALARRAGAALGLDSEVIAAACRIGRNWVPPASGRASAYPMRGSMRSRGPTASWRGCVSRSPSTPSTTRLSTSWSCCFYLLIPRATAPPHWRKSPGACVIGTWRHPCAVRGMPPRSARWRVGRTRSRLAARSDRLRRTRRRADARSRPQRSATRPDDPGTGRRRARGPPGQPSARGHPGR